MPRPKCKEREEALQLGHKRYFISKLCPKGHIAERLTSCGICVICNAEKAKRAYHTNDKVREKAKLNGRKWHAKVGTKWYHENKEWAAQLNKLWREDHKDDFYTYCANWRRNNLDKLTKNTSAYRAAKLQAKPKWADDTAIQDMYEKAKQLKVETGLPYVVDHIVPLNSKKVCGLHCEANLQILLLTENSSKGNRQWPNQ